MDSYTMFIILAALVFGAVLFFISKILNQKSSRQSEPEKPKEAELTERFYMGQYLGGLPETKDTAPLVYCGVTKDSFVFCKGTQGAEIGRIPRGSIKNISISQQKKGHCVTISWSNNHATAYDSLFAFDNKESEANAKQTVTNLQTWISPK